MNYSLTPYFGFVLFRCVFRPEDAACAKFYVRLLLCFPLYSDFIHCAACYMSSTYFSEFHNVYLHIK